MSNRTHSKLVKGSELKIGGSSGGYGPPFFAADVHFYESASGAKDARLEVEGDLIIRNDLTIDGDHVIGGDQSIGGDLTVTGNLTVVGNSTFKVMEVQQGEAVELLGSTTIGDAVDITGPSGDTLTIFSPTTMRGSDLVMRSATPALSPITISLAAASGFVTANKILSDLFEPRTASAPLQASSDGGLSVRNTAGTEGTRFRTLTALTINATQTEMAQLLTLGLGELHSYTISITAKATAGVDIGKSMLTRFDVLARNVGGVATLVGTALQTIIAMDAGLTWSTDVEVTANRLQVLVTGSAATNISWVARVEETSI